ncbi:MAG: hypothetical protein II942_02090 [Alphaproteobacteria bacterium]|nr:hypothetical protein [Alphaproteobacteria bacterium]
MKKTLIFAVSALSLAACTEHATREEYVTAYQYVPVSYEQPACNTCNTCNTCAQPRVYSHTTYHECTKPEPKPQTVMVVMPQTVIEPEIIYEPKCGCPKCGCNKKKAK